MPRKIAGQAMKRAIVSSKYLPDSPEVFRKQQVVLALRTDGYEFANSTLDAQLHKLVQQGYLERTAEMVVDSDGGRRWYRFPNASRTSNRPGYQPGEKYDLWATTDET
jgi:hypothetical protein